jgi:hypothetical protein
MDGEFQVRGAGFAVTPTFRTPEERFDGLPDFGYEPHYRFVGDLRLAHLDIGEGPPVVMLHGELSLCRSRPCRLWTLRQAGRSRLANA